MLFKVTNKDNKGNAIFIRGAYSRNSTSDIAAITFQNYDEDTQSVYNIASISARDAVGSADENGKGELLFLTNTTGCNSTGLTEKARITTQGNFCLGSNVPMSNSLFSVYGSSFFTSNVTVAQEISASTINASSGYIASFSVCNLSFSNLSTPSIDVTDLAVSSNITISNNLYVLNEQYVSSNLTVSNDLYVVNDLIVSSNTTISNNLTVNNDLTVGNDLYVSKRLVIYSKNYTPPAPQVQSFAFAPTMFSFEPQLAAEEQPLQLEQSISITPINDIITFSNDTTFSSNLTCSSNVYVINDHYISNKLVVSSNVTMCNDLLIYGNTTVNSNSVVGNDLFVFGNAYVFSGITTSNAACTNINIANNAIVQGTLSVNCSQSNASLQVNQNGIGDILYLCKNNQPKLVVSACNGWIGVGKSNPMVALDVSGDLNVSGTIRQNGSNLFSEPVIQTFPTKRLNKKYYELVVSWLNDINNSRELSSLCITSYVYPNSKIHSNIYYDVRVYDRTNHKTLSGARFSNILPSQVTLKLSNIDRTALSHLELHGRLGPNAKELHIENMLMYYT